MCIRDRCTRELKQQSDDSLIATDQSDTAENQLEKSNSGVTAKVETIVGIDKLFVQNDEQKEANPSRIIHCVSKKTFPTFLAITRDSIVGFS